ncbi:MAG: magnesium-translocating P-type ATPase [Anaerolineae bacterium SM23_ 63]|nr:MAG: magnesium-translocating P-type ATPase [Anaerolineae bacterium SM23_ 63]HEY48096.1 magnesium-translocating P-type ATPase [Anaerolineae bacterium]
MEPTALDHYWCQTSESLLAALASSPEGLTNSEASNRLQQFGPNLLKAREKATPLKLFLNQFKSPLILILLFATVVSAATQDWVDALIVLTIVLGSAVLSFVQEYNASAAIEKLRDQVKISATVLRDGESQSFPAEEIVPGDVVMLSAGSLIPADGVLLEANDFYVNQAVLTGETFPVEKKPDPVAVGASLAERFNCVFMGTNVRSGTARALIVRTGKGTEFGQIAESLSLRPPETEFERGVRRFGYLLTRMMLVLVVSVFAINVFFHKSILDSLLFAIALAVGLTPELLPAIISVNLSKGSQSMAAQGVIVRQLNAIENFGSMDVLCTDKTGTLTEGVVQLDGALDFQGQASDDVLRHAYLNARLQTGLANPLDEAIVTHAPPDISGVEKVYEIPYDFVRKRLTVVVREGAEHRLITKGALVNVLAVCTQVRDGEIAVPINDEHRKHIGERFAGWSGQGFRVLGVATRLSLQQISYSRNDEHDMVFEGYLLFFDPPQASVKETIDELEKMGVDLKIITGDNKLVALHTAETIELEVVGVLTGAELDEMRDEALWQKVERTNLFVEVDPNQKERIILALQKRGHVVGYMGDGINDAPSLHAADVGISVDKAVDVAKEAADFVLLEQDLAVLSRGVLLGRSTFANTLKYVFVTTSANFGNMFSMAGASLFLPFLPLLPMQILLTNFLTDFPAFAIANDRVDRDLLERPRRWNLHFIQNFMITFGVVSSAFDYLTFGFLLLVLDATNDQFRTGWFVVSVMTELSIMLVIRTRLPFFKSRPGTSLMIGTLIVAVATLVLPYSPISKPLGFTPLPLSVILVLLGITILYIITTELVKRIFFRRVQF